MERIEKKLAITKFIIQMFGWIDTATSSAFNCAKYWWWLPIQSMLFCYNIPLIVSGIQAYAISLIFV